VLLVFGEVTHGARPRQGREQLDGFACEQELPARSVASESTSEIQSSTSTFYSVSTTFEEAEHVRGQGGAGDLNPALVASFPQL